MLHVLLLIGISLSQTRAQWPLPLPLSTPSRYYLPPAVSDDNVSTAAPPIITKQFYSISAAEDSQELEQQQPRTKHLIIGRATRNYRVIFIRAPSAEHDTLKYTAELAPQEERTVIYVLSRKQPELEAKDILQRPQQQSEANAKPEVFFIRYKTSEEATAAQREIQMQYDELGGNTEHAAPYVAPVHSVVGALDAATVNTELTAAATPTTLNDNGYYYQKPSRRLF